MWRLRKRKRERQDKASLRMRGDRRGWVGSHPPPLSLPSAGRGQRARGSRQCALEFLWHAGKGWVLNRRRRRIWAESKGIEGQKDGGSEKDVNVDEWKNKQLERERESHTKLGRQSTMYEEREKNCKSYLFVFYLPFCLPKRCGLLV